MQYTYYQKTSFMYFCYYICNIRNTYVFLVICIIKSEGKQTSAGCSCVNWDDSPRWCMDTCDKKTSSGWMGLVTHDVRVRHITFKSNSDPPNIMPSKLFTFSNHFPATRAPSIPLRTFLAVLKCDGHSSLDALSPREYIFESWSCHRQLTTSLSTTSIIHNLWSSLHYQHCIHVKFFDWARGRS